MKKLSAHIFSVLAAAAVLSFSVTGCAAGDTGRKNISFSWWGGQSRHDATVSAVKSFEEKHSDISIDVQFGAWDGWEDSMTAAFYAGNQSDIIQINLNWIQEYNSDGSLFLDLNTLSGNFDFSNYRKEELELCTSDGMLQAVPVSLTGRIFFWNRATFEKAGLDIPHSLDELYKAGEKFRNELGEGYYPLALGEYDRMMLMIYRLSSVYGRPWISDGKLNYSESEIKEGIDFIASLESAGVIPTVAEIAGNGAVTFDKSPEWMNGKYAGIFEWDSAALKYAQALENSDAFTVGRYFEDMGDYDGGYTKISSAFAVSSKTRYPAECAEFLNYILNDPEGAACMGVERGIPLSTSGLAACEKAGLLNGSEAEANRRVMEWSSFSLDVNFENPKLKVSPEGVYYDVFSGLSYGDYSPEQAAKLIYDGVTEVLKSNFQGAAE